MNSQNFEPNELWRSGQLQFSTTMDSQEINRCLQQVRMEDTWQLSNSGTHEESHPCSTAISESNSNYVYDTNNHGAFAEHHTSDSVIDASEVPKESLLIQFKIERKGSVLNHHYYDFRKTGKTVTPLIIIAKLSCDWFCPVCLQNLGNEDRPEICLNCNPKPESSDHPSSAFHHTQIEVSPQVFVCTGTCYLGHSHYLDVKEDSLMIMQYANQVDLESEKVALYEREEQNLRESEKISWGKICFMPKRLKPREIQKDHSHYHIGFEVKLGDHVFSYRSQLFSQPATPDLSGIGNCISSCWRELDTPSFLPSLKSNWNNQLECYTYAFVELVSKSRTERENNLVLKAFGGLITPALLCTSRGHPNDESFISPQPKNMSSEAIEEDRSKAIETLFDLSINLSNSTKIRMLVDFSKKLGIDQHFQVTD